MHRSGTSFVVRALNIAGLWLGPGNHLQTIEGRAAAGNPKGNYENVRCMAINDRILANSNGAWFNPPRNLVVEPVDVESMRRFVHALEKTMPPDCSGWGWKDPRTVLTLDIWTQALERNISLVVPFRHPHAVAESLRARDRIPLEFGYALWAFYNQKLLDRIGQYSTILIRFDVDKDFLIRQVVDTCRKLGLRDERDGISRWYDSKLLRSATTVDERSPHFQKVAHIWEALLAHHAHQSGAPNLSTQ
jgi:hypothetical protein